MFRILSFLIFLGFLASGAYGLHYLGYDFNDAKNALTAFVSDTGIFTREIEWSQSDFGEESGFTFDRPEDYLVKEDVEKKTIVLSSNDSEEEDIKVSYEELLEIPLPGTASSTAESVETVIVSGQTATILRGKEGENDTAYIPVPGGGQVVVSGKGKVFEETYTRVDVTPNISDWSIFGKELPETIRIAKVLDSYLASISTELLGNDDSSVEGNLIIAIKDQSVSYVGFGSGDNQQALILDTSVEKGEAPKVLGFYRLPIIKDGSKYIVRGNTGEAVAIIPTSSMILEKDSQGDWK